MYEKKQTQLLLNKSEKNSRQIIGFKKNLIILIHEY